MKNSTNIPLREIMDLTLSIEEEKWQSLPSLDLLCFNIAAVTFQQLEITPSPFEVSFVLTNDVVIKTLNATYRHKNYPTNVLSFANLENPLKELQERAPYPLQLGDVILAFETSYQEAVDQKKSFLHHTTHLILHGLLHLLGFDHEKEEEAEEMEALEINILKQLDVPNPYN